MATNIVLCSIPTSGTEQFSNPDFLSDEECAYLHRLKTSQRKTAFWFGRFAAKEAVTLNFPSFDPRQIRILNSERPADRGKPEVYLGKNKFHTGHLSISHCPFFAAACFHPEEPVGIDLEISEPRDSSFAEMNLTNRELLILKKLPQEQQSDYETLLWSAKESMSKVLGKGLSLSTLSMECAVDLERLIPFFEKKQKTIRFGGQVNSDQHRVSFTLESRCMESFKNCFLTLAKKKPFIH